MKITGFSFIKDAIIYDYPIVEAIKSVLPVCDDFVVVVGKSRDNTLELIESIDKSKIRIIESIWDNNLREGGKILAQETNRAFNEVNENTDWAFYIQGDEVVHEKYHDIIYEKMKLYKDNKQIDGLLFKYLHFYASYDYVASSSNWYKNEIRIIKNDKNIYSYKDAQGFRKYKNKKLNVKPIDAYVYHYGWVKKPESMQKKEENFHKYWHDDEWIDKNIQKVNEFDYYSKIDSLKHFEGTHPEVMKQRIREQNWKFDYDISMNKQNGKERLKNLINEHFGLDFSYKNYRIV